jgi:hypothetical protein
VTGSENDRSRSRSECREVRVGVGGTITCVGVGILKLDGGEVRIAISGLWSNELAAAMSMTEVSENLKDGYMREGR